MSAFYVHDLVLHNAFAPLYNLYPQLRSLKSEANVLGIHSYITIKRIGALLQQM